MEVYFTDPLNGWIVGGRWDGGKILHTDNGGISWKNQISSLPEALMGIYFTDKENGWAVGFDGIIIHTEDGGNTWKKQYEYKKEWLTSVYFTDKYKGCVTGVDGTILRTTDGGLTWAMQKKDCMPAEVVFTDEKNGWIAGARKNQDGKLLGIILHTTDGGINWEYQKEDIEEPLREIYFTDSNTGWACGGTSGYTEAQFNLHNDGSGIIVYTSDGGITWETVFKNLKPRKKQ